MTDSPPIRIAKFTCSRCLAKFTPDDCLCENMCPTCRSSPYKRFPISEATGGK